MQTVSQTSSAAIGGIVKMLLLIGVIAVIICNPLVAGWVMGFKSNADWQAKGAVAAQERNFRVICPAYRDAGFIKRWVSPEMWDRSWCSSYVERL